MSDSSASHYPLPAWMQRFERHRGHITLDASAGTGKTYALVRIVLDRVLREGASLERSLVVTYTDKAARELRSRMRELLVDVLRTARVADRRSVAHAAYGWPLTPTAILAARRALDELDTASIGTIHSFCARVLGESSIATQFDSSDELLPEGLLFHTALTAVLRDEVPRDPDLAHVLARNERIGVGMEELSRTLETLERVRAPLLPSAWDDFRAHDLPTASAEETAAAWVTSVPGARRDELARDLARLDASLTRLSRARDMAALCDELIELFEPGSGRKSLVATLWEQTARAHRAPAADSEQAASRERLASLLQDVVRRVPNLPTLAALMLQGRVEQRTRALSVSLSGYRFADQIRWVREAVRSRPELLSSLRSRYEEAVIDEAQDTDEEQWDIFRRIFLDVPGRRVVLVGDPKQAIYGFRGADVFTYLSARKDVLARGGLSQRLDENHRSSAEVLAAVGMVFGDQFFTGRGDHDARVRCGDATIALVDGHGQRLHGAEVWATDSSEIAREQVFGRVLPHLCAEIHALAGPSSPIRYCPGRGAPERRLTFGDIFVLVQSRAEGDLVAEGLREARIPSVRQKQGDVFETDEAAHVRDLLSCLSDVRDPGARARALLTPFFGLELRDVYALSHASETHPVLARLLQWSNLAAQRRFDTLLTTILEESGIVERCLASGTGTRALANYTHILDLLATEVAGHATSVADLLHAMDSFRHKLRRPRGTSAEQQRIDTDGAAVQILTMHASKGLESPIVFLLGGYARAPHNRRDASVLHISAGDGLRERRAVIGPETGDLVRAAAEEREQEYERLLYVAFTRAKARVYATLLGSVLEAPGSPPLVDAPSRLNGPHAALNRRLATLFSNRRGPSDSPLRFHTLATRAAPATPAGLTADDEPKVESEALLPRIRASVRHEPLIHHDRVRGYIDTSFSRMSRGAWDLASEKGDARDRALPTDDELPRGAHSGTFIHELVQTWVPECGASAPRLLPIQLPASDDATIVRLARFCSIDERYLPHARALVESAVHAHYPLSEGGVLPGLAGASTLAHEVDLLFPVARPEGAASGSLLSYSPGPTCPDAYVVGFIDLWLEVGGRTYLLDWKTNCLPEYSPQTLREEVETSYHLQQKIYTLGAMRVLGIASEEAYENRFGGFYYAFLRGMSPGSTAGIHFDRPTFGTLIEWARELSVRVRA